MTQAAGASRRALQGAATLYALGALAVGLVALGFWPERRWLAGLLLASGGMALAWSFWDQGRRLHVTRSRWHWGRNDRVLLGVRRWRLGRGSWPGCSGPTGSSSILIPRTRRGRLSSPYWELPPWP